MIIKKIHIDKFRAIENMDIPLGKYITAIAGRNATMKTTILGIIGQPFTITNKSLDMYGHKTIDGFNFRSQFREKFKLSPKHDKVGEHKWTIYFYNNGYYKDNEITIQSMYRDNQTKKFRFWNAKSRQKGSGYAQLPVYYLSLSRLFPIGETKKIGPYNIKLTPEETDFYIKSHKKILVNQDDSLSIGLVKSSSNLFSGIESKQYDILANSAGEDNIGRIILAILSFKKLKDSCRDYKGGILLIDELDATLYPYSQRKLIQFLYECAKKFKIQIIFTTQSTTVLEEVNSLDKYDNGVENNNIPYNRYIIFLKKEYNLDGSFSINNIKVVNNFELKKAIADINLEPFIPDKINIYLEDSVAKDFLLFLVKNKYQNYINPIDINLGCTNYLQLHMKEVPEFLNSIIILDGDVFNKLSSEQKSYIKNNATNIITLPGPYCIEEGLFHFYKLNANYSIFRDNYLPNGIDISYDVCFRNFTECSYEDKNQYKKWYKEMIEMLQNNYLPLYKCWSDNNKIKVNDFLNNFINCYNNLAKKLKLDLIEIE